MNIRDLLDSLDPFAYVMADIPTEILYDYLINMEGFLEEKTLKLRKEWEEQKRKAEESVGSPDSGGIPIEVQVMWHKKHLIEQAENFKNILRKSFFITLYGFFESYLVNECRSQLQEREDILLSWGDIRGKGIDKVKICTKKVLQTSFETGPHWAEIQKYKLLRNCIIHNEGRLNDGFRDNNNKLRLYVSSKEPLLSLSSNAEIILSRDFCKEALNTITMFLLPDLFDQETT